MGNEFRVNSYENNWQRGSDVLALRDGGFVVTWSSYFNEYDDTSPVATYVGAQFYDASGQPVGGEVVMRGVSGGYSGEQQMTQLANGNLVLTWIETLDDPIFTNGAHIKAQVFSPTGIKLGEAFQVDTVPSFRAVAPDVVATKDGGFVISFGIETSTTNFDQVYYRSYSPDGTPRGLNKVLNVTSKEYDELLTKSTALSNGHSVVIWTSEAAIDTGANAGRNQLRASIFDEQGKVIRSDFGLTPHIGSAGSERNYGYSVAERDGGGFVVANLDWTPSTKDSSGTQGIYFSSYDAKGQAIGRPVPVFESGIVVGDLEMTRLDTGNYVVVWSQQSLRVEDIADDAYGVILSATGKPISKVFTVGVDFDEYDEQSDVSVAALVGGGFVVTYNSDSIDSDNEGIAGTVFGRGTAGADNLKVDATGTISGLGGNDELTGDTRGNWIFGDTGADRLAGLSGADRLDGGTGKDVLTGGLGDDVFVFSVAPTAVNVDRITDFANKTGNNDRIELDRSVFKKLDLGVLDKSEFVVGTKAKDASDHIVYDKVKGALYYDTNGNKAGGMYLIAEMDTNLSLTASDFWVI